MNSRAYCISLGAMMLGMLASCSNDINNSPSGDDVDVKNLKMQLPKTPDLVVWSGNSTLANTFGTTRTENAVGTRATQKYENDEVEINLSINDVHTLFNGETPKYDVSDLVSKLSIHVRCATDVHVVLPVPETIYCDQDDLYIFNEHGQQFGWEWKEGEEEDVRELTFDEVLDQEGEPTVIKIQTLYQGPYTAPPSPPVYSINTRSDIDWPTLMKNGGIIINVEGITQGVIDYCNRQNGDGLNFEFYNYYNRANMGNPGVYEAYTFGQLKADLDKSLVDFSYNYPEDNYYIPDFYINAFNDVDGVDEDNNPTTELFGQDCEVKPYNADSFYLPYQGEHFNGSSYNWIYTNKRIVGGSDPKQEPGKE